MTLNVSPQVEARLFDFARKEGIEPSALLEKMVDEYHLSNSGSAAVYTSANDPLMARLEARIAQAPTDPEAIRDAEADLAEFMHNMNKNRREIGAPILYPDSGVE